MSLYISDLKCVQAGFRQYAAHQIHLSRAVRKGYPGSPATLGGADTLNHPPYPVIVGMSLIERFQDDHAATFAASVAIGKIGELLGSPVDSQ